jgi:hypothetical protein
MMSQLEIKDFLLFKSGENLLVRKGSSLPFKKNNCNSKMEKVLPNSWVRIIFRSSKKMQKS